MARYRVGGYRPKPSREYWDSRFHVIASLGILVLVQDAGDRALSIELSDIGATVLINQKRVFLFCSIKLVLGFTALFVSFCLSNLSGFLFL